MKAVTPDDCEWYTPADLLEHIYRIMPIDLDPASPLRPTVKAQKHYTKTDNGLAQPWEGNIFLNPPYGRGINKWIEKAVCEYRTCRAENIILLIHAKTDTKWFSQITQLPHIVCCIRGRLRFYSPDPEKNQVGTFASLLILVSTNSEVRQKFVSECQTLGPIYKRIYHPEMAK